MLLDTAQLSSGFTLKDPSSFAGRINRTVAVALDVSNQLEELPPIVQPEAEHKEGDEAESVDQADLQKFDDVD